MNIRKIEKQDLPALEKIIDSVGLFPSSMLEGMLNDYFQNPETQDIWLTRTHENYPIALLFCSPEKLTNGTYNLYLIAVHQAHQGKKNGAEMMAYLEYELRLQNARVLIIETSGLPEFDLTRQFYEKNHYEKHAIIKDFYQEGEDKIVFWKTLR